MKQQQVREEAPDRIEAGQASYLILGATGGIGGELARRLAAAGARLALAGRRADAVASLAADLGAIALTVEATDPHSIDAVVEDAANRLGRLDGIANCVGSVYLKPAHLTTPEDWSATLAVNLTSAFGVVRAAGRVLRGAGGSVVLVSSAAARLGLPNHEAIAAAKAGVEGLTRSAAATYARDGIRVNAVAPGLVRTGATRRITESPAGEKASLGMHPLGRLGMPGDVARAIEWFLDPAQSWVTGQILGVDGGLADLKLR